MTDSPRPKPKAQDELRPRTEGRQVLPCRPFSINNSGAVIDELKRENCCSSAFDSPSEPLVMLGRNIVVDKPAASSTDVFGAKSAEFDSEVNYFFTLGMLEAGWATAFNFINRGKLLAKLITRPSSSMSVICSACRRKAVSLSNAAWSPERSCESVVPSEAPASRFMPL